VLQLLHLRHGWRLNPALFDREALVDSGIQQLLCFLRPRRLFGLCAAGWLADEIGRRVGFIALLIWGAVFMMLWVHAAADLWLWIFGLGRSFGFLGFWGPSTTLTAEVFATRIRGVANGIVRFIGFFTGFVLGPFATVALQQATGSFTLAFLTIPAFIVGMAAGLWFIVREHTGKELNVIAV